MKQCNRCAAVQPLTEFWRDKGKLDGLRGECKACGRSASLARYYRNKAGIKVVRREQHPAGRKARSVFSNALRDGKIERYPCWVCGDHQAHGHHPNYSAPLDVVWLCAAHHSQTHALVAYGHEC